MSTPTTTKRKSSDPSSPQKKATAGTALSTQTIEYLRAWMMSPEHINHPYPSDEDKAKIMQDTGITSKQLTCWFSNNRKRYWKVKMEEMGKSDVVEAAMGSTLSPQIIEYLKAWMLSPEHIQNPYPTEEEKARIIAATGIEKKQLTCWFSNNRKRFWKPKMDEIRKQYGLSESDPLPAALLATGAAPVPSDNVNQPEFAASHGDIDVNHADIMNHPDIANHIMAASAPAVEPLAEPIASLPIEDFSEENFYGTINAAAAEIHSEEQAGSKRQNFSSDDVIAV